MSPSKYRFWCSQKAMNAVRCASKGPLETALLQAPIRCYCSWSCRSLSYANQIRKILVLRYIDWFPPSQTATLVHWHSYLAAIDHDLCCFVHLSLKSSYHSLRFTKLPIEWFVSQVSTISRETYESHIDFQFCRCKGGFENPYEL